MNFKKILIGGTFVGRDFPPYLIAEIGLNHNGNMDLAKELIKAAALSGAHMVKFQKRSLNNLATASFLDKPFQKCPSLGSTQREVREKLELSPDQLNELKDYSFQHGLDFSFSVFDLKSLELAIEMDISIIKLPSHSITNLPLLRALSKSGKPAIVSLGGCTWEEREKAISVLSNLDLILMHCVSSYPTRDDELKLHTITELEQRYDRVVGYSGHENGYELSASSILLGASIIERHFTMSRSMVGLDHKISLEPIEFKKLADLSFRFFKSRGIITGKVEDGEKSSRTNYHVAVCSRNYIKKGALITEENICCKQPRGDEDTFFGGLEFDKLINSQALEDIPEDTPIPKKSVKFLQ